MSYSTKYFDDFCSLFRRVWQWLPGWGQRRFLLLFVGITGTAVVEILTLGAIALFAATVSDPESTLRSHWILSLKQLTGNEVVNSKETLIMSLSFVVVFMVIMKNSLQVFLSLLVARYCAAVEGDAGEKLVFGFMTMPYQWHLTKNSADLITATEWRIYFGRGFLGPVLQVLSDGLVVILMLGLLFVFQPLISAIVIGCLGGTAAFLYLRIRKSLDVKAQGCRDMELAMNRLTMQALHGVKEVQTIGREHSFRALFRQFMSRLVTDYGTQQFLTAIPSRILETVGFVMISATILFMFGFQRASTAGVIGTVALLVVIAWRALPAVSRILDGITRLTNHIPYLSTGLAYMEAIAAAPKLTEGDAAGVKRFPFREVLTLAGVSFVFVPEGPHALRDIRLDIPKGSAVGIIGRSGAGKSTLVDILIGLLPPSSGRLLVDGRELTPEELRSWRRSIGYVPQFAYILDASLAQNIAFDPQGEVDREQAMRCCRTAAIDFLDDLPNGLDTMLGERGVRLSGGQQQRVAIARALYGEPDVMVFDEATSSLDQKNERAILDTIYALRGQKTLIIVAHRLSTVDACDTIVWIEKGKVLKIGEPREILAEYAENMNGCGAHVADDEVGHG